jgi:hypothetical protein
MPEGTGTRARGQHADCGPAQNEAHFNKTLRAGGKPCPFARTTDRSRDPFISETMDPASRRAGRSALSSVRHFAPAARMKQQERRQADPGAAHNAGCLENLHGERLAEPMHTAPVRTRQSSTRNGA